MSLSTFLMTGYLAGILGQVQPGCWTYGTPCEPRPQLYGGPTCVARWAVPADNCRFTMYRVGGGCPYPCLANPPLKHDGTWGWDYVGGYLPHNVILGWWNERRYQGGTGAYQTDGPSFNNGEGTLRTFHDH